MTPKTLRTRRQSETLWKYTFTNIRSNSRNHSWAVFEGVTEKELYERLENPPCRPYVYLLHWTRTGKKYLGRNTAQYCKPHDLLDSYIPKKAVLSRYIRAYGMPDVKIVKEYGSRTEAILVKQFLLMLVRVNKNVRSQYLNNSSYAWFPSVQTKH